MSRCWPPAGQHSFEFDAHLWFSLSLFLLCWKHLATNPGCFSSLFCSSFQILSRCWSPGAGIISHFGPAFVGDFLFLPLSLSLFHFLASLLLLHSPYPILSSSSQRCGRLNPVNLWKSHASCPFHFCRLAKFLSKFGKLATGCVIMLLWCICGFRSRASLKGENRPNQNI